MECSRPGCESIMCDTHVSDIGYVCDDCQAEFKDYLASRGTYSCPEGQMKRHLKNFLETEKGEFLQGPKTDVDSFFKKYSK